MSKQPDLRPEFRNLKNFTGFAIDSARDLAKTGSKDEARDWHRFTCNSNILHILEDVGYDTAELSHKLVLLGTECHPLDEPSFTNDLAAIRNCLETILKHVKEKPTPQKNARRNGYCGTRFGQSERAGITRTVVTNLETEWKTQNKIFGHAKERADAVRGIVAEKSDTITAQTG